MTRYGVIEWKSSNTACVCVLWCYSDDHNWTIEKEWLCLCAMYTVVLLFMQVAVTQMALPLSFTWAVVCLVQHLPVEFMKIACGFECTLERFTIANWHTMISDTLWRTLFSSSLASQPQSVPQRRSLSVSARGGRVWRLRTTLREQLERNYWISHA